MRRLIALLMAFILAGVANAEMIEVLNPGFESPVIVIDGGANSNITNWKVASGGGGSAGTLNPSTSMFPGEAPEGSNVAFSSNRTFFQYVDAELTANTTYTLTVDVGNRLDEPYYGYRLDLAANNGIVNTTIARDTTSAAPSPGSFDTATLVFTPDADHSQLGNQLVILLYGFSIGDSQTCFDNVRFEATQVPEPSTIALWSIFGLIGGFVAWRRRKY